MNAVIFAGPTIRKADLLRICAADILPPAAMGDVYRAARRRPRAIGIIDGYFEGAPSVWHKEILWAMAEGIAVFGAASMGALRAAELEPFGMRGIGEIFANYRSGRIEDDDEVAVEHGPAEVGFIPLSEPMVNIRATLARAVAGGIVGEDIARGLADLAKQQFYKERRWEDLLRLGRAGGLDSPALERLAQWLPENAIDLKREDAVKLAGAVADFLALPQSPSPAPFALEWTVMWDKAARSFIPHGEIAASHEESLSPELVLDELRLDPDRYAATRRSALARKLIDAGSLPDRSPVDLAVLREALSRFRARHGLLTHASLMRWLGENDLDAMAFERLIEDEIHLDMAAAGGRGLDRHIIAELQFAGTYAALAQRAWQKQRLLDHMAPDRRNRETQIEAVQARLWYFESVLNRPVPDDLARYAQDLGFSGGKALDRAVLREFAFRRLAQNRDKPA